MWYEDRCNNSFILNYYKMGILLILYTNNKLNNSIFEVCLKYQWENLDITIPNQNEEDNRYWIVKEITDISFIGCKSNIHKRIPLKNFCKIFILPS